MAKDNEISTSVRLPAPALAAGAARIAFHDKAFKSRSLVFADGSTLAVERSGVMAFNEEQIAALDRHSDFERVEDGS